MKQEEEDDVLFELRCLSPWLSLRQIRRQRSLPLGLIRELGWLPLG